MADSDMAETNLENAVKLQARQYQLEILERAKTQNTIAYLETGVGKTLISVLLIKAKSAELRKELPNRKCTMFLVPSVNLVYQQSHVLRTHTNLEVGHYCGDMDVDNWVIEKWKVELERNQVFVMTAQIFLDNLRHSFMQMERVNLIVFDECHRAHGRHAYSQIMEGFYHTLERDKRPLIFGMTASPLSSADLALFPSDQRAPLQSY
ncbi:hypothetical protein CBR_g34095 [Chara braunii]|uniref:Helicase ATP-binding domain-containing protein n=1 Tax=Chara braunii TaxID=69332 RepID=A0A388LI66_CHABU|nr:hypothetical protein CBR_g34095 [Chara braunii]|eukprot:GBG81912.1 hypothetical protein CBR_g34095 [Chara braunii]